MVWRLRVSRYGLIVFLAVPLALLAGLFLPALPARADSGFGPTVNYPVTETRPSAGWGGDPSARGYPDFAFAGAAVGRVGGVHQMTPPPDKPPPHHSPGAHP